jgi:hypothetical protein
MNAETVNSGVSLTLIEACSAARLAKTCDPAVGGGRFVPVPPYPWYVLAVQGRANGVLALAQTMPSLAKLVEASMILCYSLQQSYGGGKWMMWGRQMLISACLCPRPVELALAALAKQSANCGTPTAPQTLSQGQMCISRHYQPQGRNFTHSYCRRQGIDHSRRGEST